MIENKNVFRVLLILLWLLAEEGCNTNWKPIRNKENSFIRYEQRVKAISVLACCYETLVTLSFRLYQKTLFVKNINMWKIIITVFELLCLLQHAKSTSPKWASPSQFHRFWLLSFDLKNPLCIGSVHVLLQMFSAWLLWYWPIRRRLRKRLNEVCQNYLP